MTQIFPGVLPLYKNGVPTGGGAVGIGGDGVDQDDIISAGGGSRLLACPGKSVRIKYSVRGVRLPLLEIPRGPNSPTQQMNPSKLPQDESINQECGCDPLQIARKATHSRHEDKPRLFVLAT